MSLCRMRDGVFDQVGVSRALNTPKKSGDSKQFPGTALAGEPRYRNLVDNALIGIADVSVGGEIIYANQAVLDMIEYESLDELRKINVIELWHCPRQRAEFVSKLRQDGYVNNYEIEYLTKTGKITHTMASAILDGDMISQVVINISERKRADADKAKLRDEVHERLKELNCLYTISNSVWTKESLDEIFQDAVAAIPPGWNYPEITRGRLRYKEKEWVSEPFEETEWKQSSDIMVAGKPCGNVEVYYLEERPPLDEGPFMLEERNLLDSIAHTLSQVLGRRQAEEEKRRSAALFDSVFSLAPVGMAIYDTDMRYINVNETLANINGASIDEHIRKRPIEMLPAKLGGPVQKQLQDIMRTGQPILNTEFSGETFGEPGVTRTFLASIFPIRGISREIAGMASIVVETSEVKQAEEKLRQSQKMEALGTLAGGIAHDFNNLLYPIILNANLLLENHKADSEEYALLDDIVKSSLKAKDLVSQILVFARYSDSTDRIHDLVLVADEVMKLVRPALPEIISIERNFPNSAIPVSCDSSQIYQVMVNLFTNAQQAISGNGEIKVTLDTVEIEEFECIHEILLDGKFARLTMTDNGVGMDDETRVKMFDPFFTTKKVGQGTGLGLSTVFGIVHNHGGGITVSSELGSGTTVGILLPLAEDTLDELRDPSVSSQDDTNNESILFVDDVESIRKSAKACLERSGYNVTTVSSGQEALAVFLADPDHFNLVMTDQTMANMTGKELSIELLKQRPDIPIVICTGHSDSISPESSAEIGIRAFLQKPVAPTELRRVVRQALDEAKPG